MFLPAQPSRLTKPVTSPQVYHAAEGGDDVDDEELLASFRSFASFGAGAAAAATPPGRPVEMDGPRFAKLCRETGLQAGRLNSVGTDIIFSKVKAKVRHGQGDSLCLSIHPTCKLLSCTEMNTYPLDA